MGGAGVVCPAGAVVGVAGLVGGPVWVGAARWVAAGGVVTGPGGLVLGAGGGSAVGDGVALGRLVEGAVLPVVERPGGTAVAPVVGCPAGRLAGACPVAVVGSTPVVPGALATTDGAIDGLAATVAGSAAVRLEPKAVVPSACWASSSG